MESSQGPCNHCGVEISPQWRKGPPEKLVLCNACGLWYSKRGTLENYAPTKRLLRPNKWFRKSDAIVHNEVNLSADEDVPSCAADPTATKCTTSLSVISSPQNSTILKEADEDQIPGNSQPRLWDFSNIPRKKRSRITRTAVSKFSHIMSLQRNLLRMLENDRKASESTENLLKQPGSTVNTKDESEASTSLHDDAQVGSSSTSKR